MPHMRAHWLGKMRELVRKDSMILLYYSPNFNYILQYSGAKSGLIKLQEKKKLYKRDLSQYKLQCSSFNLLMFNIL